jgi:hypothetical protein
MRYTTIALLLFAIAPACAADRLLVQLRAETDSFPIATSPGAPSRVVFTTEANTLTVTIVAAAAPSTRAAAVEGFALPASPWWRGLVWRLVREHEGSYATVRFAPGDPLASRNRELGRVLAPGDRLTARFALPSLRPGVYHLTAKLGTATSEGDWFRVSNGTEDDAMRLAYARYKVVNSRDRDERRRYLRKIAELDDLNAAAWIELGDLSLADGSQAEVTAYYETALRVLARRRETFLARGAGATVAQIDGHRNALQQLLAVLPDYFTHRDRRQIEVNVQGGKRYILTDRASGHVLATIRIDLPSTR